MTGKAHVEIIIAVHDEARPLRRAIESVLTTSSPERIGIVVVRHNLTEKAFAAEREYFAGQNVRWAELNDGARTPATPFNYGIAMASADYLGIMGSDDKFEAGAIDALLKAIDDDSPDVVIYPLRKDGEDALANPLVRPRRSRHLDAVKDRMAYRTAPLALVSREILQRAELAFQQDLPVGEDAATSAKLWFGGFDISFRPRDPGYVIMDDGPQRVTLVERPAHVELAAYRRLIESDWVASLGTQERAALVTKIVRVHVLELVFTRTAQHKWLDGDLEAIHDFMSIAIAIAPKFTRPFSRADRLVVDALSSGASQEELMEYMSMRNRAGKLGRWVTQNPFYTLHREGTLRRMVRYAQW